MVAFEKGTRLQFERQVLQVLLSNNNNTLVFYFFIIIIISVSLFFHSLFLPAPLYFMFLVDLSFILFILFLLPCFENINGSAEGIALSVAVVRVEAFRFKQHWMVGTQSRLMTEVCCCKLRCKMNPRASMAVYIYVCVQKRKLSLIFKAGSFLCVKNPKKE